jgi:peptidyl-prolyl cis-trans isomerase B (cyclophilin B)
MTGRRDDEPPGAFPPVWMVLVGMLALVVGFVLWLALTFGDPAPETGEESPRSPTVAGEVLRCDSPPDAPSTHPTFERAPDPSLAAGTTWRATITTSCGPVEVLLDGAKAPASVASFIELSRAGYYDDSVCNRLTSRLAPTRFLQCGDPTGRRDGDPGYDLPLENVPADRRYPAGTVAIARGPEVETTAGEFLFVYETFTAPPDEPVYSVIGEVVSGGAVIAGIAAIGGEDHLSDWYPFTSISVISVSVSPE